MSNASDRLRLLALVRDHAVDAVAFQGLSDRMHVWFDEASLPTSRSAAVAYFDTGSAWIAAGGPISRQSDRSNVARRFVEAGKLARRRVSFFAVEDLNGFSGWETLHLGEQPTTSPREWIDALARTRPMREQLRRARAKGVRASLKSARELDPTGPLRGRIDDLLARWLASRRIEPMAFLVQTDPYCLPEEHLYVVTTRGDDVVGLLSAVPAYGGCGWLVEHLVCARGSPNGTAETLVDALHRSLIEDGKPNDRVSLGLAPLSGRTTAWMREARTLARPLFDFEGLRRFKARLHPTEWRAIWLVTPAGTSALVALADALTAFAGGSLVRFALRSLFLHARGLLWLLAVGLVPWTALLLWLNWTHEAGVAGYSSVALAWWIAFDVVLAAGLFRAAFRPANLTLLALIAASSTDAILSVMHLHDVGLGPTLADSALRLSAAVAPCIGATTLLAVTLQRRRERSRSGERR